MPRVSIPADPTRPVLTIEHLSVAYRTRAADLPAVVDVSLRVQAGECVGLVGESGCGKTTVALAIMNYLGRNGRICAGRICFQGRELRQLSRKAWRQVRGAQIAMVYQEPGAALNPSLTIAAQLCEVPRYHAGVSRQEALDRARQMLCDVDLADVDRLLGAYPHQLSGGQQQRVVIAMALLAQPTLLLLDEPTTALDTTVAADLVRLLGVLCQKLGTSMLYISHNLGRVMALCQRVYVMYAGEVIETGPVDQVFGHRRHPYTHGLLRAMPRLAADKHDQPLQTIAGQPPQPQERPPGCAFAPRCTAFQAGRCDAGPIAMPDETSDLQAHAVRCVRWQELLWGTPTTPRPPGASLVPGATRLQVSRLSKYYALPASTGRTWLRRHTRPQARANADITFTARARQAVAIVGESGCGKSTLARIIMGLETATSGSVCFEHTDLAYLPVVHRTPAQRRALQMVFQNPHDTLNPSLTIGAQLARVLKKYAAAHEDQSLGDRVGQLLEDVHLPRRFAERRPEQLSGGEKQRVALARAFAGHPALVVADEPVSALDVSVQAAVVNLLVDLHQQDGTTLLFISHDLGLVRYLADRVVVLYLGQIMEQGTTAEVFAPPYHPYTAALLAAMPRMALALSPASQVLAGSVPSAVKPPPGCPLVSRCPQALGTLCATVPPPLQEQAPGHVIACHIPLETLCQMPPVWPDTIEDV